MPLPNHLGQQQRKVGELAHSRHVGVARQDAFDEGRAGSGHTDDEDRSFVCRNPAPSDGSVCAVNFSRIAACAANSLAVS